MKCCKGCLIEKDLLEFGPQKRSKDGLNGKCKSCVKQYNSSYYSSNLSYFKEKRDKWNDENREIKNKKALSNYNENKEKYSKIAKLYRKKNGERLNKNKKEWQSRRSVEEKRKYRNDYSKRKKQVDKLYELKCSIRSYISSCLRNKGYTKGEETTTTTIIGCSFYELKLYLESKFEDWMSWENKGLYNGQLNYGWDIDHIIPISHAKNEKEVIKLNHYTNLQPLCSKVNRDIKKDSIQTR
jgi:hypothetical protein